MGLDYLPFQRFAKIVRDEFTALETQFGCVRERVCHDSWDCAAFIRYSNATTGVEVRFSTMREMPNVSLHQLSKPGHWEYQGFGLVYLIRERCPDSEFAKEVGQSLKSALNRFDERPSAIRVVSRLLRQVLNRYAQVSMESAVDVLRGDFTVFPHLESQAMKESRRLKRGNLP